MEALRATFRPEFLNRIDEIVFFQPLGREELGKIVDLQVAQAAKQLESRQITLELTSAAREAIFREGFDPAYGARPLRRAIQKLVQDPLAMRILEGRILPGAHVVVDVDKKTGGLRFEAVDARIPAASK
jgi:ATP-dependent Clp protease ATP-binding subunit ClpB